MEATHMAKTIWDDRDISLQDGIPWEMGEGCFDPSNQRGNCRGRHYPEGVLCVLEMSLLHGMLWGNIWPETVVVPKTGINSGRSPLPAAEVHAPLTGHINYLCHKVYKQAFSFFFGYVSWCAAYDKQLQLELFGELHSLLAQLPRRVDELFSS